MKNICTVFLRFFGRPVWFVTYLLQAAVLFLNWGAICAQVTAKVTSHAQQTRVTESKLLSLRVGTLGPTRCYYYSDYFNTARIWNCVPILIWGEHHRITDNFTACVYLYAHGELGILTGRRALDHRICGVLFSFAGISTWGRSVRSQERAERRGYRWSDLGCLALLLTPQYALHTVYGQRQAVSWNRFVSARVSLFSFVLRLVLVSTAVLTLLMFRFLRSALVLTFSYRSVKCFRSRPST